jgi:hypothetical protein
VLRTTADASTRASSSAGDVTRGTSATLDGALESTTKLTSFDETLALDPDVADSLVKEAYAASGNTLAVFAEGLGVSEARLAEAIVAHAPAKPTRQDLVHLLAFVVPHLKS